MEWTPQQDTLLLKALEEGLSASKIALRLHVSRNAVIGRKHRIKDTQFPCVKQRKEEEQRQREATQRARADQRRVYAKIVARMLASIAAGKPRNVAVVVARQQGATLEAIGEGLGLSRERVRQIVEEMNLAA